MTPVPTSMYGSVPATPDRPFFSHGLPDLSQQGSYGPAGDELDPSLFRRAQGLCGMVLPEPLTLGVTTLCTCYDIYDLVQLICQLRRDIAEQRSGVEQALGQFEAACSKATAALIHVHNLGELEKCWSLLGSLRMIRASTYTAAALVAATGLITALQHRAGELQADPLRTEPQRFAEALLHPNGGGRLAALLPPPTAALMTELAETVAQLNAMPARAVGVSTVAGPLPEAMLAREEPSPPVAHFSVLSRRRQRTQPRSKAQTPPSSPGRVAAAAQEKL